MLENFAKTLENAIAGTAVRVVVVTGAGDLLSPPRWFLTNFVLRRVRRAVPAFICRRPCASSARLRLGERGHEPVLVEPGEVAFLQYTGGTTGKPKGAMLTHRNMIANLRQVHAWLAPRSDRRARRS